MEKADIFLSPEGDDSNDGSATRPFAALERARIEAQRLRDNRGPSACMIECAEGYYRFDEPVVFGLEDSTSAGEPTIVRAADGERPVFGSGVVVDGWRAVPALEFPSEVPADARNSLYLADYPPEIDHVCALFDGERRIPRGRGAPFAISVSRDEVESMHRRDLVFPKGCASPVRESRIGGARDHPDASVDHVHSRHRSDRSRFFSYRKLSGRENRIYAVFAAERRKFSLQMS